MIIILILCAVFGAVAGIFIATGIVVKEALKACPKCSKSGFLIHKNIKKNMFDEFDADACCRFCNHTEQVENLKLNQLVRK